MVNPKRPGISVRELRASTEAWKDIVAPLGLARKAVSTSAYWVFLADVLANITLALASLTCPT